MGQLVLRTATEKYDVAISLAQKVKNLKLRRDDEVEEIIGNHLNTRVYQGIFKGRVLSTRDEVVNYLEGDDCLSLYSQDYTRAKHRYESTINLCLVAMRNIKISIHQNIDYIMSEDETSCATQYMRGNELTARFDDV